LLCRYHVPSPKHGNLDYPDSTLINGLGRTWANTTNTTLAVQAVQKGLRYRLRIVSLSCEPAYTFSIDGHNLTVIEADGILHQPYLVDSVTVYPGQRYSAILHANQRAGNYWIRALPVDDGLFFPNGAFTGGINSAILRYNGAPAAEPTTQSSAGSNELVEANMTPRVVTPAPGTPDVNAPDVFKLNMAYTLNFSDFQFEMNGNETHLPSVPTLLQIMSGAQKAQDALAPGQYISIPANSVVQLSFPGADPAPTTRHSIHLHGHPFAVIRSAGQADYNFVNPPWRDVVSMGGPGDNVTIRFQTDNSGPWFLHCHVDWHLAAGFFATFVEDTPSNIAAYNKPSDPNAMNDLCEAWDSFSAGGGQ
jgi:iron transport multicopper oxidase